MSVTTAAGLFGIIIAALVRASRSDQGWYVFHKCTDWNVVRRRLGYESLPTPTKPSPPPRRRKLLGHWPVLTNWDEERARLGYGTADAAFPEPPTLPPDRGLMATLYRLLIRLAAAWLVIMGALFALAATASGPLGFDLHMAAVVVLGPALLVGALAWIIKPPA
jgi:hypothetical protein